MSIKPLLGAVAVAALLGACSSPPPPRPVTQAPAAPIVPPPTAPTGDGRVASIRFEPASSVLTPAARSELGPVLDRLMANPSEPVRITSYSDVADMPLARERTQAVRLALTERGVARTRIRVMNARMMPNADPNAVQVQVRGRASPGSEVRASTAAAPRG
ncbi:OmpA family protein [Roseococcus sp. YIM B11640]|uniref:OmpA family protein n=1 Tax=Roseococcus sp. YIM B11640 TaxID=3133973 RepID=UPI003C7A5D75